MRLGLTFAMVIGMTVAGIVTVSVLRKAWPSPSAPITRA